MPSPNVGPLEFSGSQQTRNLPLPRPPVRRTAPAPIACVSNAIPQVAVSDKREIPTRLTHRGRRLTNELEPGACVLESQEALRIGQLNVHSAHLIDRTGFVVSRLSIAVGHPTGFRAREPDRLRDGIPGEAGNALPSIRPIRVDKAAQSRSVCGSHPDLAASPRKDDLGVVERPAWQRSVRNDAIRAASV